MVNLLRISHELVVSLFSRISGIKILLLDKATLEIISLIYTQTELLEKEVFLTELIDNASVREKLPYFSGIFFIRPTRENISILCNELKNPLYKDYYIYFTTNVSPQILQRLAVSDEYEVIKRVREVRIDVNITNSCLYSLNINNFGQMYNLPSKWTTFEETLFKRILDGVYSASVLLGEIPEIRYLNNSPLCRNIAFALERRLMDSNPVELLMYGNNNNSDINSNIEHNGNTVIVILDRREDPITPLLTQWTYQSMIHELITIKQNKITIGSEEYTLSEEYDNFYDEHKYDNFGDIGFFIRDMVNQQELNNNYCKNLNSIDDINRFIDTYPEFKKESGIVCKHVNIMHKLSEIVQNRELMRISAIEQDIFVNDNIIEHSKEVGSILDDPKIDTFDKIRLALIYSLKYQENEMQINNFKYNLGNNSKYIDKLLEIAGKDFRSIDLFQSKSLFNIAKNTIRKTAGGTVNENIYIQHKTLMYSLLENLVKGKLKYSRFPSTDDSNTTKKPQKVMVFIVGGVTYEEVRDANEIKNLYDVDIILGGTDIINSKSFIDDIDLLTNS